jgi:hypothetical protein
MLETVNSMTVGHFFCILSEPPQGRVMNGDFPVGSGYHPAPALWLVELRVCTLGISNQYAGKTGQYCPGLTADH